MSTLAPAAPVAAEHLRTADRCDRCSAVAYVRTKHSSSGNLLDFCAHHFGKHWDGLMLGGFEVVEDIRASLTAK